MQIILKDTEYTMNFASRVGAYYTYEVEFGSTAEVDEKIFSPSSFFVRLAWAILKTDNQIVNFTYQEFLSMVTDDQWTDIFTMIGERFKSWVPAKNETEGDASETVAEVKNA